MVTRVLLFCDSAGGVVLCCCCCWVLSLYRSRTGVNVDCSPPLLGCFLLPIRVGVVGVCRVAGRMSLVCYCPGGQRSCMCGGGGGCGWVCVWCFPVVEGVVSVVPVRLGLVVVFLLESVLWFGYVYRSLAKLLNISDPTSGS